MNILQKIKIYLTPRIYPYNKNVDKFLKILIKEGKDIKIGMTNCHINYGDDTYIIDLIGFPSSDLSHGLKLTHSSSYLAYREFMPSKKTQIKFWEFLEKEFGKDFIKYNFYNLE